jgi:hypothetical protein
LIATLYEQQLRLAWRHSRRQLQRSWRGTNDADLRHDVDVVAAARLAQEGLNMAIRTDRVNWSGVRSEEIQLGEDPSDGEGQPQAIAVGRVVTNDSNPNSKVRFSLTIYVGDEDMGFYGMSRQELSRLGEHLIMLAGLPKDAQEKAK